MDGVQAVEGELNAIVKEYLQMLDYPKSIGAFDKETAGKNKEINIDTLPPSQDENQMHIQKKILQAYDNGNNQVFTRIWTENIPEQLQEENSCKRLEFNIQLYFAIFAIKQESPDQHKVEKGLKAFKTFLETRGAVLSQTTEFVTFYALPFVPASSLKSHPSFSVLFEDSWAAQLRQSLKDFLSTVLYAAPLPYLYKLFTGSADRSKTERTQYENHILALQQQISEHEHRATLYFKRYTKIQADYKNLINIAAELVDSLENAVRGKMVTPEYLRSICERLFSNSQNPVQSTDFTRPGTAASLLRASVANAKAGLAIGNDVPYLPSLNYIKVKEDLRRVSPRKQALLVQALRLRLTRSQIGEQRDAVISGYIANDILGCSSDIKHGETVVNLLMSKDDVLKCQTAMLFNAVASFTAGRAYIGQSEVMMKELITCLKHESEKSKTGENLLGAMQKLSLRRQVQSVMIDCGLVLWLIKILEEPETLNDYSLEYSVALLMNLCLRSEGKKQCIKDCESILQLLADLLGHENREVRPYVNGTLYSILALPSIRQRAVSMGLEEVLRCYVQEDDPDMNRQIKFIIKQMNTVDKTSSDDPLSDNEDEEDDDEEGDVLDAELDEEETEIARSGELFGEQLLSAKYLGVLSSLSSSRAVDTKGLISSSLIDEEKPLTRPVTPRSHPKLSAIEELSSRDSARSGRGSQNGRPKTQSSGNAARRTDREASNPEMPPPRSQQSSRQSKGKLDPFQTKPKIPRTPDSLASNQSRPVSTDMPLPTRSVSPPVPKPSSRGQDPIKCFYDCLKPCRNMKKRHFHCKICDYISERLDNMKRHIPYHFIKLKKERKRAPDGVKMVCHEYFTETCNTENCSYSQETYQHLHCTLCKTWTCNIKKSYKYRIRHLNRSHCMFFTDKENPSDEVLSDLKGTKRKRTLHQPGQAKVLTYPEAKEEVLNSRRRAKKQARESKNRRTNISKMGDDEVEKEIDVEYFKNIGRDVQNIIKSIDFGCRGPKDSLENSETGKFELSFKNAENPNESCAYGQGEGSTYSVTLNGDLSTILAVFMALKKSGITLEDRSLREIISRNTSCSANDIFKGLSLIGNTANRSKGDGGNGGRNDEESSEESCSSVKDEGFSETIDNVLPDFPASFPGDFMIPLNETLQEKGIQIEAGKILEFLSKIVDSDVEFNSEPQENLGQESNSMNKNSTFVWEEGSSLGCTKNQMNKESPFSDASEGGSVSHRLQSSSNEPLDQGKNHLDADQTTNRGMSNVTDNGDSTEGIESAHSKQCEETSVEAVNIYDIINGFLRNDDIEDVNNCDI